MELGIRIPHAGPAADAAFVPEFCAAAESAGFHGLWTVDHVVAPWRTESIYTLGPQPTSIADGAIGRTMGLNLEMNTTLAVAAAVTDRIKLCTGVAVLPIRNAVLNARQIASIDLYSGGRVVYGVGIGWLREEAEAMGLPWDRRGDRADEHIRLLRALWSASGDVVEFHGRYHDIPPIDPNPLPVQRPIPILIGGHSAAAMQRVARLGDGWIAAGMGVERLGRALDELKLVCEAHGRQFDDLQIVCDERTALDPTRSDVEDQCAQLVDRLEARRRLGVAHVRLGIDAKDRATLMQGLTRYSELVLPVL